MTGRTFVPWLLQHPEWQRLPPAQRDALLSEARMMTTVMPIMMTVLFYQFPSGLVLYWMVSNFLGIGHQLWVRKQRAQES